MLSLACIVLLEIIVKTWSPTLGWLFSQQGLFTAIFIKRFINV